MFFTTFDLYNSIKVSPSLMESNFIDKGIGASVDFLYVP